MDNSKLKGEFRSGNDFDYIVSRIAPNKLSETSSLLIVSYILTHA